MMVGTCSAYTAATDAPSIPRSYTLSLFPFWSPLLLVRRLNHMNEF